MYDETIAKLDALQQLMLDKFTEVESTIARLDEKLATTEELQKALQMESGINFLMIDEILESHSNILEILVEESPDVEMVYNEEEDEEVEEPKSATILKLIIDNTKGEDK